MQHTTGKWNEAIYILHQSNGVLKANKKKKRKKEKQNVVRE